MDFLIESALLTQGSRSLSNDEIRQIWGEFEGRIAWIESGQIRFGEWGEFLPFRKKALSIDAGKESGRILRVNHFNFKKAIEDEADAVLTASGCMSLCARSGIPAAVTAGIGGFFPGQYDPEHLPEKDKVPPDLATLCALEILLISSGPKDMLDAKAIFDYLAKKGVYVAAFGHSCFTGYVFKGDATELPLFNPEAGLGGRSAFLINEIPEEERIKDREILEKATASGREAEMAGAYYHPAVNEKLDELTGKLSAKLQIRALLANAKLAKDL